MVRHRGDVCANHLREFAHAALTARELVDDKEPRFVGQGLEDQHTAPKPLFDISSCFTHYVNWQNNNILLSCQASGNTFLSPFFVL